jgi:mRNA-degrading endonuclease YafQ of YafQ-DinJ toxin-antitoxin module
MARNFSEYRGRFSCHSCKDLVLIARFYSEDMKLTWLCSNRHMSEVILTRGA